MKRTLILPVSAAALGVVLALGVFALKRAALNALEDQRFITTVELRGGDLVDIEEILAEVDEARLEAETIHEIVEQARQEIRHTLETNRDLTEAQRTQVMRALERLEITSGPPLEPGRTDASPDPESGSGN
jgi:head-tail adaptor